MSSNQMELVHLKTLKESLRDLQEEPNVTEKDMMTAFKSIVQVHDTKRTCCSDNDLKYNTHNSNFAFLQWPVGSNPSYNPAERKDAEINEGWIRFFLETEIISG